MLISARPLVSRLQNMRHVGDYDDKVIIYSLVDSLTELSDVDGVVFEVEGSQDLVYGENLDFSETYTANYSMCN